MNDPTVRDLYAAAALIGLLCYYPKGASIDMLPKQAFDLAERMLAERPLEPVEEPKKENRNARAWREANE